MLCIANPGHAPEAAPRKILQIFRGDPDFANRKLKKRRCNMQNNRRKFSITAAGWAAYESLRAHQNTAESGVFYCPQGFLLQSAMLCIANPGHAPEAAPRKILQIFRGDPDFANRKLKKRRCNMQNNRRKFSITAAGWAAYESLRALVAARRTSPQRSVSRELSACTPCGSFSRRRKMQGVRRAPRSCRNYRAAHSFLLRGMAGAAGGGMRRVSADLSWRGKRECQA